MRATEASAFFSAFENLPARQRVKQMLAQNYASAVLQHHPRGRQLLAVDVEARCTALAETVILEIQNLNGEADRLFPLFSRLSRKHERPHAMWFAAFTEAYQEYRQNHKMQGRYHRLHPWLQGTTCCDIGSGGGEWALFLQRHHADFRQVDGLDVMDWRTPEARTHTGLQILDLRQPGSMSKREYDTLCCLAVLHHVASNTSTVATFLRNCHPALHSKGVLIIEEDVILPAGELAELPAVGRQAMQKAEEQPFFGEFLKMDATTQRAAIVLIDFLANCLAVGVPDMPFPCGFRTLKGWLQLFERCGFETLKIRVEGFVQGNFNQSSHVLFLLRKRNW